MVGGYRVNGTLRFCSHLMNNIMTRVPKKNKITKLYF